MKIESERKEAREKSEQKKRRSAQESHKSFSQSEAITRSKLSKKVKAHYKPGIKKNIRK